MKYVIDCKEIKCFDDFVEECNKGFIREVGGEWNGNLDAFNDYLSWPEPNPYNLDILGSLNCKNALGYKETLKRLEKIIKTCHPSNRNEIYRRIRDASNHKGDTLWDEIKEILEENIEWVKIAYK